MLCFTSIPGDKNPADILSKHWGHQQIWAVLRSILFATWCPTPIDNGSKGSEKILDSSTSPDRDTNTQPVTEKQVTSGRTKKGRTTEANSVTTGEPSGNLADPLDFPPKYQQISERAFWGCGSVDF